MAQEAAPTTEYVKLVQEFYVENAKLKEGQPEAAEYKKYMQEFATTKAAQSKDIANKLQAYKRSCNTKKFNNPT